MLGKQEAALRTQMRQSERHVRRLDIQHRLITDRLVKSGNIELRQLPCQNDIMMRVMIKADDAQHPQREKPPPRPPCPAGDKPIINTTGARTSRK